MSDPKPIPMNKPISFEDWKAGIPQRRAISKAAVSGQTRRTEGGGADRQLREAFSGKRAPSQDDLAIEAAKPNH